MRSKLRRLERAARGHLASFELLDGSRYYFDPASGQLFLHWCGCLRADSAHDWPEPPVTYKKLCEAKCPELALDEIGGGGSFGTFPYDPEILINERRLEPRGLVSRCDPQTGEHHIRDPWEHYPTPTSPSSGMEFCNQASFSILRKVGRFRRAEEGKG